MNNVALTNYAHPKQIDCVSLPLEYPLIAVSIYSNKPLFLFFHPGTNLLWHGQSKFCLVLNVLTFKTILPSDCCTILLSFLSLLHNPQQLTLPRIETKLILCVVILCPVLYRGKFSLTCNYSMIRYSHYSHFSHCAVLCFCTEHWRPSRTSLSLHLWRGLACIILIVSCIRIDTYSSIQIKYLS